MNQKSRISTTPSPRERIATRCICCGSTQLTKTSAILMPFIAERLFGWKPLQIDLSWGLKTINQGTAYALCNSLFCTECELLFLDIRFTEDEVLRLYTGYRGEEYVTMREKYEPGYRMRNQDLGRKVGYMARTESFILENIHLPKTILDWGGNDGTNTPLAATAKMIEIFDININRPKSEDQKIRKNLIKDCTFDLITCCNVLEHVPYPINMLRDIRNHMSPTSSLFIEVPYERIQLEGRAGSGIKRHWHEHINFFSEASLKILIKNAGLDILAFRFIPTLEASNQTHVFQAVCARQ
jgi:hypothetical protein